MRPGLSSSLIVALLLGHGAIAEDPPTPELDVESLPVALSDPTRQISGFSFLEGPVYDPVSQQLIFTDVTDSVIYRMQPNTDTWVVLEDMQGCNGLAIGPDGDLYVCRSEAGDVVKLDWDTKAMEVVVDTTPDGDEFNAPNDLIFDALGGLYFSDPNFKSARAEPWEQGVYYRAANGRVHKVLEDLPRPNGVTLSPDGDVLYVLPFGDSVLMAYPVMAPGVIGAGRRLAELPHAGDGMAVDTFGNIFVTQPNGNEVLAIDPSGRIVNRFKIGDRPSNCAFGGREDGTLFVTCRSSIWTIPMNVAGHRVTAPDWSIVPESHIHLLQYVSARIFLRTLSEAQLAEAQVELDDPSRSDWNYMPGDRTGLHIGGLDGNQKMALWQLISGGVSPDGFETLHQIRMIEDAVHEAGREDVGPDDYWITIYGDPAAGHPWNGVIPHAVQ